MDLTGLLLFCLEVLLCLHLLRYEIDLGKTLSDNSWHEILIGVAVVLKVYLSHMWMMVPHNVDKPRCHGKYRALLPKKAVDADGKRIPKSLISWTCQ